MSNSQKLPRQNTTKPIALAVVAILGGIGFASLYMVYDLTKTLIKNPGQDTHLAVFVGLIGGLTTLCGTAIGYVGGTLSASEKTHPGTTIQQADEVTTGGPTNVTPGPGSSA